MWCKQGNNWMTGSPQDYREEGLEPGNYIVQFHKDIGYYLTRIDDFIIPKKLYGDVIKDTQMVISSHKRRNKKTGVALLGQKGFGKTLLAKNICIKRNLPTIVVKSNIFDPSFIDWLEEKIDQPIVIFIDEFDKVFTNDKKDERNILLSLLDGVSSKNILWIVTTNETSLPRFMESRPSRFLYKIKYDNLTEDTLVEICQDKLNPKYYSSIPDFKIIASVYDINMDNLIELIKEFNARAEEESLKEIMKTFNIAIGDNQHLIEVLTKSGAKVGERVVNYHPLSGNCNYSFDLNLELANKVDNKYLLEWLNDRVNIEEGKPGWDKLPKDYYYGLDLSLNNLNNKYEIEKKTDCILIKDKEFNYRCTRHIPKHLY